MARLRNITTGKTLQLKSNHVFGRSSSNVDTIFDDKRISQIHASIRFEKQGWRVIDHSRNGTRINGRRINSANGKQVSRLDKIDFLNDHECTWQLDDDSPPETFLEAISANVCDITLQHMTLLPNENKPAALLYKLSELKWVFSLDDKEQLLNDGDLISLNDDKTWRLHIEHPIQQTQDIEQEKNIYINNCCFEFTVSADEEHTTLTIHINNTQIHLGERIYHYILLTLARKKLEDFERGIQEESQGWINVEELLRLLRVDCYYLNTQIYRLRKQVEKSVGFSLDVFERRLGCIRFSGKKIAIKKDGYTTIEKSFEKKITAIEQ